MIEKTEIKDFVKDRFHAENQQDLVAELVAKKQAENEDKEFSADDFVLVRVTDHLPENRVIKPISQVPFVIKAGGPLSFIINDIVKANLSINIHDPKNWPEIKKRNDELTPFSTQYRSTVHFTLNSLVQNHGAFQNTFDGKYIIIEPLNEQFKKGTNFSSIREVDTCIKGPVQLSENASILIDEVTYSKLTYETKEELNKFMSIYCYTGDREVAFKMLMLKLKYIPEEINEHGFKDSKTSAKMVESYIKIAAQHNTKIEKHINLVEYAEDDKNNLILWDIYNKLYMKFLFSKIQISDEIKKDILETKSLVVEGDLSSQSKAELKVAIENIGLEEYKKIVDEYNACIEEMIKKGTFPTNDELINGKELKIDGLSREI